MSTLNRIRIEILLHFVGAVFAIIAGMGFIESASFVDITPVFTYPIVFAQIMYLALAMTAFLMALYFIVSPFATGYALFGTTFLAKSGLNTALLACILGLVAKNSGVDTPVWLIVPLMVVIVAIFIYETMIRQELGEDHLNNVLAAVGFSRFSVDGHDDYDEDDISDESGEYEEASNDAEETQETDHDPLNESGAVGGEDYSDEEIGRIISTNLSHDVVSVSSDKNETSSFGGEGLFPEFTAEEDFDNIEEESPEHSKFPPLEFEQDKDNNVNIDKMKDVFTRLMAENAGTLDEKDAPSEAEISEAFQALQEWEDSRGESEEK